MSHLSSNVAHALMRAASALMPTPGSCDVPIPQQHKSLEMFVRLPTLRQDNQRPVLILHHS